MVTPLTPASSPSATSRISVEKRCRSPQRRYMRISICAQSWASTPPEPTLTARMASDRSYGPFRRSWNSRRSTCRWRAVVSRSASVSTSASFSSPANSTSSSSSVVRRSASSQGVSSSRKLDRSRMTCWAAGGSDQRLASALRASSAVRRACLAGASKTHQQAGDTCVKRFEPGPQLVRGGGRCGRKSHGRNFAEV